MGLHAFETEPEHCSVYRMQFGTDLPKLYGFADRWNMPIARHRRVLGSGVEFRGVDHYVLTSHIGGAAARRWDRRSSPARPGAFSLQRPGSSGKFASDGRVDYAHFYFRQSLLCEVSEEAGLARAAEPDDFFAVHDPAWSRDAEAYLLRALDRRDPPTPMEMDGRAYFVILGLLRAALQREDLLASGLDGVERADMRRVIREMERRLAEPLRLTELAATVGMSPFHFARVFKATTGEPPAQFLLRRRVEVAVDLIRDSTLSLAEIAARSGFSSQSHMTRRVHLQTGRTPTQIRSGP